MLRVITLDYWDTIYDGASVPERKMRRREALARLLVAIGVDIAPEDFVRLYTASAIEAERWWREEHRGYTTADRIRWLLAQLAIERPDDCEHIAAAVRIVDDTLLDYPPILLPGAEEVVRALSERFTLGIISDTGFASGEAQNRVLARDGLLSCFSSTIYSMDIGHAKPRPEPFLAALSALGASPADALHVGDNERTDVGGALSIGMRAIRLDAVRKNGDSRGEYVAGSLGELGEYLLGKGRSGDWGLGTRDSGLGTRDSGLGPRD
jgi:putative hydrolase of the HAD superfamily